MRFRYPHNQQIGYPNNLQVFGSKKATGYNEDSQSRKLKDIKRVANLES